MKHLVFFTFFSLPFVCSTQIIYPQTITTLSDSLKESSGLLYLNNKIITHNDSGNDPYLYEIDTANGSVLRAVYINNASHIDWEDICADNDYIYIGDFGNNLGARTDLAIIKVEINEFLNTANDTVNSELIYFNFASQTSFTPSQYSTNYDVEAMCTLGDSLFIFTKNWGNSKTNYYALPKNTGNYSLDSRGEINSYGFVTGATFNSSLNEIVLCGYSISEPFLIRITNFLDTDFKNGNIQRFVINNATASIQFEGITAFNNGYYLSTEQHSTGNSELLEFKNDDFLTLSTVKRNSCNIFPNPANQIIKVTGAHVIRVELIDINYNIIKVFYSDTFSVNEIKEGIYLVKIYTDDSKKVLIEKIIITH